MAKRTTTTRSPNRTPRVHAHVRGWGTGADAAQWLSSANTNARVGAGGSLSADLRDPYAQEPWVYACVRRISDALETADLGWFTARGDTGTRLPETHPLVRLWERPNPHDTASDLLGKLGTYLSLTGECFLFLTDAAGEPVQSQGNSTGAPIAMPAAIWPVMGGEANVQADIAEDGTLLGWRVPRGRFQTFYPASSVVLVRYPDPRRMYRGLGPLGALYGTAVQSYLAARYQSRLLANGGDPGGVISVEGFLRDVDRDRLQSEIEEAWSNTERAGEVKLLEGGATYTPVATSAKDMAWGELVANNRKVMSAVFGVPDSVLGGDASNYATFRGHLRVFWTLTNLPILQRTARTLRTHLVQRIREPGMATVWVEPDTQAIEALQGDAMEGADAAAKLFNIGVPLNTALAQAGLSVEPIDGGDVSLVPNGLRPLVSIADEATSVDATADPALALTGIQVQSMVSICEKVAQGLLPKDTGTELLVACFPLDRARAEAIMAKIVEGSVKPPAPAGSGKPPADDAPADDAGDDDKAVRAALAAAPRTVDDSTDKVQRQALWRAAQRHLRPLEQRLHRKVRATFYAMRKAQLEHLEQLAKGNGKAVGAWPPAPVAAALAKLGDASCRTLCAAYAADSKGGMDVAVVRDCTGAVCDTGWRAGPAVRRWAAARPALADHLPLALTYAQAKAAGLTDAEVQQLVNLLDAKWTDEIAGLLLDTYERTVAAADTQVQGELGANFVATPDPAALRVLADKAIKVAEGIQSTVAEQVRAALVRQLAEGGSIGTLQDRVLAQFKELAETTKQQFNMHSRRALTIARTEVAQANAVVRNERIEEAADQGVVVAKVWTTAVDKSAAPPYEDGGYVRSQHWQMDGQKVGPKSSWTMPDGSTLPSPAWPGGPAHQVINCRCSELALVPGEEDDEPV